MKELYCEDAQANRQTQVTIGPSRHTVLAYQAGKVARFNHVVSLLATSHCCCFTYCMYHALTGGAGGRDVETDKGRLRGKMDKLNNFL